MKFLSLLGLAALIHCASAVKCSVTECGNADTPSGETHCDKCGTILPKEDGAKPEAEKEQTAAAPSLNDPTGDVETKNDELGGLDDDGDDELTLISCDEESPAKFAISRKAALMCNLVKNIIEGDKTAKEIEIKKVSGPILNLIIEYLKHHDGKVPAEIAKPIRVSEAQASSEVMMEKIVEDAWDAEFINKQTKKTIFQIILGANYMDIKSLLHLGCAKIATLIKGKSPEEIKKILGDDEETGDNKTTGNSRRLAEILGLDLDFGQSAPFDRDL